MTETQIKYAEVADVRKVPNPAKRPVDGYGANIPTDYQVRLKGESKWRKVYAICYSNVASFFINVGNERRIIHDYDLSPN